MSEKLCLQWNEFRDSAVKTIGNLREDKDFTDVTLVAADGTQFEAHKVILANSSPFFQQILKTNQHPKQLIYMRGVKSDDLLAVVNFLYCGEANVCQENLDSFLAIAMDLELKGLKKQTRGEQMSQKETFEETVTNTVKVESSEEDSRSQKIFAEQLETIPGDHKPSPITQTSSGDLMRELDEKCLSLMEKTSVKNARSQLIYRCKICGKEDINGNLKNHIENSHLEGVSIPCNFCEKTFR